MALAFLVIAAVSLVLDRGVAEAVETLSLPSWPARLFLPSLAVGLVAYITTGPGDSFRLPTRTSDGKPVSTRERVVIVAIWLGVVAASVGLTLLISGREKLVDALGFSLTHPPAMALLFQGGLLQLASGLWPARRTMRGDDLPFKAMLVVAFIQAASQIQYSWPTPSLGQCLRVLVLSFIFSGVRFHFGSMWAVVAGYAINAGMAMR